MVVAAFPVAKLGALVIKQISKPIANAVKEKAKTSPVFRKYVCLPPAQFYNWVEVTAKMWILHLGKPVNIPVMNEKMAIELGSNLLGEGVIFIIAAGLLIFEYNRSSNKEAAKELAKQIEIQQLQHTIAELFMQTEEQAAHIREITRKLGDLETKVVTKPWVASKRGSNNDDNVKDTPPPSPPSSKQARQFSSLQQENEEELLQKRNSLNVNFNLVTEAEDDNLNNNNSRPSGIILKAVNQIEAELFFDPNKQRERGLLNVALNHLYHDVYRIPVSFY